MAIAILTRPEVVDAVAVADIETVGRAKPPNGMLDEARENRRKPRIEGAGVDVGGRRPNDLGAAAMAIAAEAIGVGGTTVVKDAGTMQKVMDQGVDGDHAFASLEPMRPTRPQATARRGSW